MFKTGNKVMKKVGKMWVAVALLGSVLAGAVTPTLVTNAQVKIETVREGYLKDNKVLAEVEKAEKTEDESMGNWVNNTVDQVKSEIDRQSKLNLGVYVVQHGDTLDVIAEAVGISKDELIRINELKERELEKYEEVKDDAGESHFVVSESFNYDHSKEKALENINKKREKEAKDNKKDFKALELKDIKEEKDYDVYEGVDRFVEAGDLLFGVYGESRQQRAVIVKTSLENLQETYEETITRLAEERKQEEEQERKDREPNKEDGVEDNKPTKPENPVTPTEPSNPTQPENPTTPTEPETTVAPENPVQPENPVTPTEPETTVAPENPTTPTNPTNPTQPENPTNPSTPVDKLSGLKAGDSVVVKIENGKEIRWTVERFENDGELTIEEAKAQGIKTNQRNAIIGKDENGDNVAWRTNVSKSDVEKFNNGSLINRQLLADNFLKLINGLRKSNGLNEVGLSSEMGTLAGIRSTEDAQNGSNRYWVDGKPVAHVRNDEGKSYNTVAEESGLGVTGYFSENLGTLNFVQGDFDAVHEDTLAEQFFTMWTDSAAHKENMLNPNTKYIGFDVKATDKRRLDENSYTLRTGGIMGTLLMGGDNFYNSKEVKQNEEGQWELVGDLQPSEDVTAPSEESTAPTSESTESSTAPESTAPTSETTESTESSTAPESVEETSAPSETTNSTDVVENTGSEEVAGTTETSETPTE